MNELTPLLQQINTKDWNDIVAEVTNWIIRKLRQEFRYSYSTSVKFSSGYREKLFEEGAIYLFIKKVDECIKNTCASVPSTNNLTNLYNVIISQSMIHAIKAGDIKTIKQFIELNHVDIEQNHISFPYKNEKNIIINFFQYAILMGTYSAIEALLEYSPDLDSKAEEKNPTLEPDKMESEIVHKIPIFDLVEHLSNDIYSALNATVPVNLRTPPFRESRREEVKRRLETYKEICRKRDIALDDVTRKVPNDFPYEVARLITQFNRGAQPDYVPHSIDDEKKYEPTETDLYAPMDLS
jgi:hypothetical protein